MIKSVSSINRDKELQLDGYFYKNIDELITYSEVLSELKKAIDKQNQKE